MRIKRLPTPKASFLGQHEGLITKGKMKAGSRIDSAIPSFDFEVRCKVQSFKMTIISPNKSTFKTSSESNKLTDEMKAKIAAYEKLPSLNAKQLAKKKVISAAAIILDKVDARSSEIQDLIKKADKKIHQSFFVETSDTIDLLESIQTYLRHKPSTLPPLANRIVEVRPIGLTH